MTGCGDAGTSSDTQTGSAPTSVSDTDPTVASTVPTGSAGTTEGVGTMGMTGSMSTTDTPTGPGPTSDPTADPTTMGTTAGTSTGAVSVSTQGTTAGETSDSTTEGPKLDVGSPGCPPDNQATTFDFIWIANTTQGTVSKIETLSAANSGVYGRIQAVG